MKNINVWSDGGIIVTNNIKLASHLRLLRNHGLQDRDTVSILGFNSRLDTIQAVVGNWLLPQANAIAEARIENASYYDDKLSKISEIRIPSRLDGFRIVYHLYIVFAKQRDALLQHCLDAGIEAKVHYPVPIYRQPALAYLGYEKGDFPVTDQHSNSIITFPCDQHIGRPEMDYVIECVEQFYRPK